MIVKVEISGHDLFLVDEENMPWIGYSYSDVIIKDGGLEFKYQVLESPSAPEQSNLTEEEYNARAAKIIEEYFYQIINDLESQKESSVTQENLENSTG